MWDVGNWLVNIIRVGAHIQVGRTGRSCKKGLESSGMGEFLKDEWSIMIKLKKKKKHGASTIDHLFESI